MTHKLPELPYAKNALEPHISQKTLEFHHGKHHQTYVNNLNNLIKGTEFEQMSLLDIIKKSSGGIFNNAAQVWNHTFYFEQLSSTPKKSPSGTLENLINSSFGSLEKFKAEFDKAAATLFGSGWAWLVKDDKGKLSILQTSNAETPIRTGTKCLMVIDVWEHAYYLDTQNARPKYIENFWNVLDWKVIEGRL
ncbi:MAG TPA: superoxide dismutase [Salinivirgaceae bacterium]|mgnify:FL=1|nr:superoxide dismutase [Salinivirgaceae bacterium]